MRLLWLLVPLAVLSKEITLQWLEKKPLSLARDYYIWRFLDQNISSYEAQRALELAKNVNYKIFFRYADKIGDPAIERIAQCLRMPLAQLIAQDGSCIAAAITPAKMERLNHQERIQIYKKLLAFPIKERLKYLLAPNPIQALRHRPRAFVTIFNASTPTFRKQVFDRYFDRRFLAKVQRVPGFSKLVKMAVTQPIEKLALSLTLLDPKSLDARSAFYIGLFAYSKELPNLARTFFQRAYQGAYFQRDRDRALFWLYKTTKRRALLHQLANSWDLNIYSILACEIVGKSYDNYLLLDPFAKKSSIDLHDPFVWFTILQESSNYDPFLYKDRFKARNTMAAYAIFLEKGSKYKTHPFLLPYEKLLNRVRYDQKALLYAIARQESRFIPGSISRSFALGPLQFMPFLARHYAQKLGIKRFDLDMMFDEKVAVPMALIHLQTLMDRFANPLFVAYAYNGGGGYTTRRVLDLFKRYEPLLAMELVTYEETKEYGKRVLANYYIYRKILGKPFRLYRFIHSGLTNSITAAP